ncbi:MAG: TIGR01777 family oxidoreductase, partial [Gemmatimonadaceae bacterium]|nr:TIGR01777 family oxidoreductase [Gemmatimonadaceae bacterium]
TGGTGMIGRALTDFLRTGGHAVRWVTRRPDPARGDIGWDPARGTIDAAALAGCDAIVHLAGASVGERWTPAHKRAIRESREQGTRTIARAIAALAPAPRVFVSASAIGIYGDTGDTLVDEGAPAANDFLGEVAQLWERETAPARDAGVRTCIARIGVVLSAGGGALAKMLPAFRAGVGGPLGGGRQWMSWISLDDVIGALQQLLLDDECVGAYNLVAPNAVTNADFVATLGAVLRRPAVLPVPALALTTLFGEMATHTILTGQRVQPARLAGTSFVHEHPRLEDALRFELGRLR